MSRDLTATPLAQWQHLLVEIGIAGDALFAAIEGDELLSGIAAMMQLRQLRADLRRVEAPSLRGDDAEATAVRETVALAHGVRVVEAAMDGWLQRPLPGDAVLLASPLGIAALADALLPAAWDFSTDLVVLVGGGLEPVAHVLADLGQRRIAVLDGDPAALPAEVIAVTSFDELSAAVRTMVPNAPKQLALRAALGISADHVEAAGRAAHEAMSDLRVHGNTVQAFSRTWIDQGARNMAGLAKWPTVGDVGDAFAGVPMVIVAPGPSLARNASQLRALKGRAIITAFSHSLKPVLAAGIVPDLIMTVDPQDVRYHFGDADLSQTCLVNAATVHPALFELPAGRMLTLSANSAIDDWIFEGLGEEAMVPGGGSVATSAFSLALRWKCDPIVFVGLDLSFPGGQYYVSTSSDGGARAEVDARGIMRVTGWSDNFHAMKASGGPGAAAERTIELPGWAGGTVPSSFMFSMFHRWFVERMRAVTDTRVYNCTEGGAFIAGMTHAPLADVVGELRAPGALDIGAMIDAATAGVDGERRRRQLVRHLTGYRHGLARAKKLATRAAKLIASEDVGPELVRLERALAKTLRPMGFVSLIAQRELDRAHDVARRAGSPEGFLAASASLLATLGTVIAQLEPALHGALGRLQAEHGHGRAA